MDGEKRLNKETVAQGQTLITLIVSLNLNAKLLMPNTEKTTTLPD